MGCRSKQVKLTTSVRGMRPSASLVLAEPVTRSRREVVPPPAHSLATRNPPTRSIIRLCHSYSFHTRVHPIPKTYSFEDDAALFWGRLRDRPRARLRSLSVPTSSPEPSTSASIQRRRNCINARFSSIDRNCTRVTRVTRVGGVEKKTCGYRGGHGRRRRAMRQKNDE